MEFLAIIISLVIWGFIFWLIQWGVTEIGVKEPWSKGIRIALVIGAVIIIIGILTGASWTVFPIATRLFG